MEAAMGDVRFLSFYGAHTGLEPSLATTINFERPKCLLIAIGSHFFTTPGKSVKPD